MKIHKKIAQLFGYELTRASKNHLTIEGHLAALFKKLEINCVIDVGANVGQYALELRENGYKGHIISFEPVKNTFEKLREKAQNDPQWEVHQLALGAAKGSSTIQVTQDSSLASFQQTNDYAQEQYHEHVTNFYTETVQIDTLDSLWNSITEKIPHPRVHLKLDTQGFDLEVIAGATHSISTIKSLQSEISLIPLYKNMPDYLTALGQYRSLGFEITGMYPVSRDKKTLRVVEFDCVMIKS